MIRRCDASYSALAFRWSPPGLRAPRVSPAATIGTERAAVRRRAEALRARRSCTASPVRLFHHRIEGRNRVNRCRGSNDGLGQTIMLQRA